VAQPFLPHRFVGDFRIIAHQDGFGVDLVDAKIATGFPFARLTGDDAVVVANEVGVANVLLTKRWMELI
jgi:hypothetical protein